MEDLTDVLMEFFPAQVGFNQFGGLLEVLSFTKLTRIGWTSWLIWP